MGINWGKPERAPQNGSVHAFNCPTNHSQKFTLCIRKPPTGSVVVHSTVQPFPKIYVECMRKPPTGSVFMCSTIQLTVPRNLHFKCGFSDQRGDRGCLYGYTSNAERKEAKTETPTKKRV